MYSFKVIFCRNLFIYLYKNKQRKVLLKSSIYSFLFSGVKKQKLQDRLQILFIQKLVHLVPEAKVNRC